MDQTSLEIVLGALGVDLEGLGEVGNRLVVLVDRGMEARLTDVRLDVRRPNFHDFREIGGRRTQVSQRRIDQRPIAEGVHTGGISPYGSRELREGCLIFPLLG
jgi:hypothetical protein